MAGTYFEKFRYIWNGWTWIIWFRDRDSGYVLLKFEFEFEHSIFLYAAIKKNPIVSWQQNHPCRKLIFGSVQLESVKNMDPDEIFATGLQNLLGDSDGSWHLRPLIPLINNGGICKIRNAFPLLSVHTKIKVLMSFTCIPNKYAVIIIIILNDSNYQLFWKHFSLY